MKNRNFALFALAMALAACADSDRTAVATFPVSPPPPPPPPLVAAPDFAEVSAAEVDAFRTAEYKRQRGLEAINAAWLYARGEKNSELMPEHYGRGTGEGVLIGVWDSGMDHRHHDFIGKVDKRSVLTYRYAGGSTNSPIMIVNSEVEDIKEFLRHYINDRGCTRFCVVQYPDGSIYSLPTASVFNEQGGALLGLTLPGSVTISGQINHGHSVASLAAAARNGRGIHGVAFSSRVLARAFNISGFERAVAFTEVAPGEKSIDDDQLTEDISFFLSIGVPVLNMSFGKSGFASMYDEETLRSFQPRFIRAMAQAHIDEADRTVLVWAAGNSHGSLGNDGRLVYADSPGFEAGIATHIAELRPHSLAVVAVDLDPNSASAVASSISSFSNRCGIAKAYCIAAPGSQLPNSHERVHDFFEFDLRYDEFIRDSGSTGTSFAAPLVSGAIAALMDYFGGRLGNTEVVARVLATANKTGIYADSDIYGQGLLDLKAASEPFGEQRIIMGGALDGPAMLLAGTQLRGAAAFGDAWQRLGGAPLLTVDSLGTPFPITLGTLMVDDTWRRQHEVFRHFANPLSPVADGAVQGFASADGRGLERSLGLYQGFGVHPGYGASPGLQPGLVSESLLAPWPGLARFGASLGLSQGALSLVAFSGTGQDGAGHAHRRNHGMALGWNLGGGALQMGYLQEGGGFGGNLGDGALQLPDGDTLYAGGHWAHTLGGNWHARAALWVGHTAANDSSLSLVQRHSAILSSQFSAALVRSAGDAELALQLGQPLRVERGDAMLSFASDRDRYRRVYGRSMLLDLEPSGRQWQLDLSYSGSLRLGRAAALVRYMRHPGHSRSRPAEMQFMARWQAQF